MKKKTKKKIKVKVFLKTLLIIVVVSLLVLMYRGINVKNIYVLGNDLLTEQTIIELAGLEDYPKLYKVSRRKINNNLLTSPFIENVKITKTLTGKITLDVTEYKVLYKDVFNNKIVLSNGKSVDYGKDILGITNLINEVDKDIYDKFIQKMNKIDDSILLKISEIKYDPNELDNKRFLLYMTDQNYVYLTLSKFEVINTYNDIVPTLEGKKGILYLDSGNHFQIKK